MWRRICQYRFISGIIVTVIVLPIFKYVAKFPIKLLEDAVMGWIVDKFAQRWSMVIGIFIDWVIPFLFVALIIYLTYLLTVKITAKVGQNSKLVKKKELDAIPSRREALEDSKVAWGLWHTGTCTRIEKLIKSEGLKRILILEPDPSNLSIDEIAKRSSETKESIINQIEDTTREALEKNKEIKWYSRHRESSLTIYDNTPIEENEILKPCSENAWMHVQYLAPNVGVDERQGEAIYNKGRDRSRFIGYYQEYERIWERESEEPNYTDIKQDLVVPTPDKLKLVLKAIVEARQITPKGSDVIIYWPKFQSIVNVEELNNILLKLQNDEKVLTINYFPNYLLPFTEFTKEAISQKTRASLDPSRKQIRVKINNKFDSLIKQLGVL